MAASEKTGGNGFADAVRTAWERAGEGPVAVVDCREEIPCNPCEDACRRGCIVVGDDICAPPRYDPAACNGCGRCVALCPGMAVFLLDRSVGGGAARVTVPYEMREVPVPGAKTEVVDGEGYGLGEGNIVKVSGSGKPGETMLVTVEVPEAWALKVRGVRFRRRTVEEPEEVEAPPSWGVAAFCRCEEITYEKVRESAGMGFHSLRALRRFSRVGLGLCQGRFCQSMLREEFLSWTCRDPEEAGTFRVRPPVRPVRLSRLGGENG